MKPDHKFLNQTDWYKAHCMVAAWKNDQQTPQPWPRCDEPGVTLVDYSAQPFTEWFELTCSKCDLEVKMHLPLAPTPGASV